MGFSSAVPPQEAPRAPGAALQPVLARGLWQRSSLLAPRVPASPALYRLETINGAMFLRKMELETKLQLLKVI